MNRKFAFLFLALFSVEFAFANEQLIPPPEKPIDNVKNQWRQNAQSWLQKTDSLENKLKAISGNEVPKEIMGQSLILIAYTNFIRSETESIVMKEAGEVLVCHLLFNTEKGLLDIAYIYNKNGNLDTVRFDSIPVGVFVSITSKDKAGRYIFIYFSKLDITIALDRLDPFAAFVTDI